MGAPDRDEEEDQQDQHGTAVVAVGVGSSCREEKRQSHRYENMFMETARLTQWLVLQKPK